jgi:hypothetical protein
LATTVVAKWENDFQLTPEAPASQEAAVAVS